MRCISLYMTFWNQCIMMRLFRVFLVDLSLVVISREDT